MSRLEPQKYQAVKDETSQFMRFRHQSSELWMVFGKVLGKIKYLHDFESK